MKPTPLEILREMLAEVETDCIACSDCSRWSHQERAEALRRAIDVLGKPWNAGLMDGPMVDE